MFKVAIIGPGYIARNHIGALSKMENAKLVAIVGRTFEKAQALADEAGCAAFETIEEAVARTGANVAILCLPTWVHEEYVIRAAKLKCHVLCEKPITFSVESFDRMTKACEENGVRLMVAQVARWWPEFLTVKEKILGGELGDIHMISEKRLCQHPTWATWHRDPAKSGGGLYDLNIHDIDYLYDIFGRPERIYATGWKSPSGCWNHVSTNLTWKGGVKAIVETSLEMTGAWPFTIELRATGDKGTISYSLTAGLNINDGERGNRFLWFEQGSDEVRELSSEQEDMFYAQMKAFLAAVERGEAAPVTLEQSRGVLEVIEATIKSLEEGVAVEL